MTMIKMTQMRKPSMPARERRTHSSRRYSKPPAPGAKVTVPGRLLPAAPPPAPPLSMPLRRPAPPLARMPRGAADASSWWGVEPPRPSMLRPADARMPLPGRPLPSGVLGGMEPGPSPKRPKESTVDGRSAPAPLPLLPALPPEAPPRGRPHLPPSSPLPLSLSESAGRSRSAAVEVAPPWSTGLS